MVARLEVKHATQILLLNLDSEWEKTLRHPKVTR